jgi:hypothetical protein
MTTHTFPSRLVVTLHAISRWRERAPGVHSGDDDVIRKRIGIALVNSRPVRLKNPVERAMKSLWGGGLATFHHHGQVVLVVTDSAVVSVYCCESERWEVVT